VRRASPAVGLDACVLIEGLRVPRGLCAAILRLAASGGIRLVLVEQAELEARRALDRYGLTDQLDRLLADCIIERIPDPDELQVAREGLAFLPIMRHETDLPIAVAIYASPPDVFVSGNTRHWRRSLGGMLGVPVLSPRAFLTEVMGIQPPPRWPKRS
jgi:hypothetical protein